MSDKGPEQPRYPELHWLERDTILRGDVKPGDWVLIEANEADSEASGFLRFQVIVVKADENERQTILVELDATEFVFAAFHDEDEYEALMLPKGTIMQWGVSYRDFTRFEESEPYDTSLSVARDFIFREAVTTEGVFVNTVIIPQVKKIYLCQSRGDFEVPASLQNYNEMRSDTSLSMDERLAEFLEEYYPDELIRQKLQRIMQTFHPEAQAKLLALLEFALEDDVLGKFYVVFVRAYETYFKYELPQERGLDFGIGTQRAWFDMVNELGLTFPRAIK